ncbi:MAG: DUF4446 family protein [Candidatus Pacebacteria bacterium]|nr:DUF4446 family protein [Candidatus Paceibacterota bacterium]
MISKLEIIFFILIFIVLLCNIFWIVKTEKRLKRFFIGKKAKDLEDTLIHLEDEVKNLILSKNKIEAELAIVNQKLKKSIRGLETIRFNPFPDQGGNQSFAISMQNEEGDGVVISSLYARERMSVFAKPIKKGSSTYELTDEEREVINKAKV